MFGHGRLNVYPPPPPFEIVPKYSPYSPIHLRPTYITEWQSRASIQCLILKGQMHLRVMFVNFSDFLPTGLGLKTERHQYIQKFFAIAYIRNRHRNVWVLLFTNSVRPLSVIYGRYI